MVSTLVVEAIREVVDLTHGSFMDLIFMDLIRDPFIPAPAFIRDPFIPVPAFIRDHFNRALAKTVGFSTTRLLPAGGRSGAALRLALPLSNS